MSAAKKPNATSAARQVLESLLRRGESARARRASERVSLTLSAQYAVLRELTEIESFHAEIALAVRASAITSRAARTGDRDSLSHIDLLDLDRLASHLGVSVLSDRVEQAGNLLQQASVGYPIVASVLEHWRSRRKLRGKGPEAASDLLDAIKLLEARRSDSIEERLLRRVSHQVFKDSKRIEAITPWLDLLLSGELTASGLRDEDIWSSLGLRREPQPMLVAGSGRVVLRDASIMLCRPYLGLPTNAVTTIESPARYLLTIENLTSFHEAASLLTDECGLIIYSGGMPSPAWRALYRRVLGTLSADASLYHWGDIDEGGFRIAANIAHCAEAAGRQLHPWLMSPRQLPASESAYPTPSASTLSAMTSWARDAGWHDLATDLLANPLQIEQEALDPLLPQATTYRPNILQAIRAP